MRVVRERLHGWRSVVGGLGLGLAVAVGLWWRSMATREAVLATSLVVGAPLLASADEVRTFSVTVDGKPGGTFKVAIEAARDGTETIATTAELKVKTTLYTYTYALQSVEVWRNGRLVSVEARSNDDGKKHSVKALAAGDHLAVTVDKDTRRVAADVITSTGVRVPAGDKARDVVFFDVEDGSEATVRVEPLGARRVVLVGQTIEGVGYKLSGKDVAGEWWFDQNGRLIHQEMKWDGHKVVFELAGVTK